jgi:glyoxylate reductase
VRVYLTYDIPSPGPEILRGHFEVVLHEGDSAPTPAQLVAEAADADGIVTLIRDRITDDVLDDLPGLRAVANYGVGYDNIDVGAATRHGVIVTNTPDVLTAATADVVWTLMLAAARRVLEGDQLVRSGEWKGWDPRQLLGADVSGATLGLVGMGRIGQAVARRAAGFDMRVLYTARRDVGEAASLGATRVDLDTLLAESDFVSIHVALAPETNHLIDAAALSRMKPTAILVNTARGPVVDEQALVEALRSGVIAAAGLDVYEREPALAEGLAGCANCVLLPHLGSATVGARAGMARLAAENMVAALSGHRPPNILNPEVLDGR